MGIGAQTTTDEGPTDVSYKNGWRGCRRPSRGGEERYDPARKHRTDTLARAPCDPQRSPPGAGQPCPARCRPRRPVQLPRHAGPGRDGGRRSCRPQRRGGASRAGRHFVIDYATLIDDISSPPRTPKELSVARPFEVTPIFVPGMQGNCPLFIVTREGSRWPGKPVDGKPPAKVSAAKGEAEETRLRQSHAHARHDEYLAIVS